MPNLGFIAVKCVQCSTMQVKQQKKSSNKWTCAVCNQKQSVTSVFARGFQAKDLRVFVQNFNMARADSNFNSYFTSDPSSTEGSGMTSAGDIDGGNGEEDKVRNDCFSRNKRNDWSEYLDLEPTCGDERNGGKGYLDEAELFVNEMPNQVPAKRRKPFCSLKSRESRGKKSESNLLLGVAEDKERSTKVTKKMNASSSKWNEYLEEEMEKILDVGQMTPPSNFSSVLRDDSRVENQNQCSDVKVEDEIHPDFF